MTYPFPVLDLDEIENGEGKQFERLEVPKDISDADDMPIALQNYLEKTSPVFSTLLNSKPIPKHLITGTNGKTTTARLVAHIIREVEGKKIGLTSTSGIYIDGHCPQLGDFTGPWPLRNTLLYPIGVGVFEVAKRGLIREGVIFYKTESATITNVTADHLGLRDIHSVEEMAEVKKLILYPASKSITLNLDNEHTSRMLQESIDSKLKFPYSPRVFAFTEQKERIVLHENVVYLDSGKIMLKQGEETKVLLHVKELKYALEGAITYLVSNILTALATAIGIGISPDVAAETVKTFSNTLGRETLVKHNNRTFVIDIIQMRSSK